jgi:hypothetical protein
VRVLVSWESRRGCWGGSTTVKCDSGKTNLERAVHVYVDFVAFEYGLLIKYQSMSSWELNLPIKQHNLIGT